jgi:hypothetical protein
VRQEGNDLVSALWQRTLSHQAGAEAVRPVRLSEPHGERGEGGWYGEQRRPLAQHRSPDRGVGCEPPPTVVGSPGDVSCDMGVPHHRWAESASPMRLPTRTLVSPEHSRQGKPAARPADSAAATGGRRTRMPVRNRPERGGLHRGTSPPATAGGLPPGLSAREHLTHRRRRQSR